MHLLAPLLNTGIDTYFERNTALSYYFNKPTVVYYVATKASVVDICKYYDGVFFPGAEAIEAAVEFENDIYLFRCFESFRFSKRYAFYQADMVYDIINKKYLDPYGVYPYLRNNKIIRDPHTFRNDYWRVAAEAAVLVANFSYSYKLEDFYALNKEDSHKLNEFEQKILLIEILTAPFPQLGLRLLMETDFICYHWPLLQEMNNTFHNKEYHPEGNVWEHTLEMFVYRKSNDLSLSLGLLLHDCGKPYSEETDGRVFNRHAQIGVKKGVAFLRKLGFTNKIINDAAFLIGEHMLPGIMNRLPLYKTESVLESPLFPLLLEVYRCDLLSTYRGPEGFYQACKKYRDYLKNSRNPFRTSEGKKLLKKYVEL